MSDEVTKAIEHNARTLDQSEVVFPERADKRVVDDYTYFPSEIKGSPFVRSRGGSKEFDTINQEAPLVAEDIGTREKPGLRKKLRKERNGQAYWEHKDPAVLHTWDPLPDEVTNLFNEVFADRRFDNEGNERFKIVLHPHLKRVCIVERELRPDFAENIWRLVWICQTNPEKGYIPKDYRNDVEKHHLAGFVGDFKLPELEELEAVDRCNKYKYGINGVENYIHSFEVKEEVEKEKGIEDYTYGFLSYYFNMAVNDANQEFGSGQRMQSYDTISLKSSDRFEREEKDGYTVVHKRTREEQDAARFEGWKQQIEERAKQFDVQPQEIDLRRKRSPEQLELNEIERQIARKEFEMQNATRAQRKALTRAAYESLERSGKVRVARDEYRSLTKKELAKVMRKQLGKVK